FDIAGSGLSAQSVRLNTVASNLANADSENGDPKKVYKARHPVFQAVRNAVAAGPAGISPPGMEKSTAAVRVTNHVENQSDTIAHYEPGNPLANEQGYVYSPNVNAVEEMVDMISASRSYQNNVEVLNTSKELMLATLRLGQ